VSWNLEFTATARREILKLDPPARGQLEADLQQLVSNPLNGKPLSGRLKGIRSWRSGDYRILYGIRSAEKRLTVFRVAHRREVYRL